MQPIAKNNCDFPTLRQSGCVYVDKTAWFHRLATDPQASFFFLARPRRFGKSLMISTLKAMFQGRKDLFEGLAIKDYDGTDFDLCVPDEEVRQDLSALMSGLVADKDVRWAASIGVTLRRARWDKFFDGLTALYAGAVYGTTEGRPHELSYARCLKFLLQGQGFRVMQEVAHASGRTDIVADHPCGTYVFELKVDKPPKLAMSQMQRKKYAAPCRAAGKPVWAVGLSFDGKTRQFAGGVAEAVK